MVKKKRRRRRMLSKKQQLVINELFEEDFSEAEVLQKHNLSSYVFRKWLQDERFIAEMEFKISSSQRQSRLIIAKYAPVAAAKLVQLTESDKEETARKACLDIISVRAVDKPVSENAEPVEAVELESGTASRLLKALAEDGTDI